MVNWSPRRYPLSAALGLALALAAAPAARAAGDYHVITNDDSWEIGTGTDSQDNAYCSAQEQSSDQSYGIILLIYPLGDDPSFELHVFNNGWSIPANADIPARFNFSDGSSWTADGSASSDRSSVVDYTIAFKDMKDFMNDFSQSDTLEIVFVNGNEPNWTADLTGTSQASVDLLSCASDLLNPGSSGQNTQPYNAPQPNTQPYNSQPDSGGGTKSL
jgi:hypothetical protein